MIQDKEPLVSVVMATFNEPPKFVEKAIESILSQTYKNIEVLILDDSDSVETVRAIDSFSNDLRVKIIRKESRMGFVPALNLGLKESSGKYIARMDGDDIALPERFRLEVEFLEKHPNVVVVGGAMNIIDGNESVVGERSYPENPKTFAIYRSPLAHPTVMMRKDLCDMGFTYNENLKKAEDLDLWLRYIKKGFKIRNLKERLLNYRVLDNFAEKRGREQFDSAYMVRKSNFSWRCPFFSLSSIVAGFILNHMPMKFFEIAYGKENKRLQDK